jgi:LPXTG-site transpeptidase (sortase) family protein
MINKNSKNNIFYFLGTTTTIFVVTFSILYFVGLVPETFKINNYQSDDQVISENIDSNSKTRPDKIIIPEIGVDTIIEQPNTVDVAVLDEFLKKGAVHYPGSGSIEKGNMFIFGHSTNWQVVQNQAYKTFNDLDQLVKGDEIQIVADEKTYIYKVNSVKLVDESEALVKFDNSQRTLTISTCNTFGKKQERWVVEASFFKEA